MKTETLQRARCDSQGNIIAICLVYDPENPQYVLKKFDSESNLMKEIAAIPIERKPGVINLFSPSIYMAVDDEDNIILGYPEGYEIRIFNPEGDLATPMPPTSIPRFQSRPFARSLWEMES